jgi:hypothetical protein
MNDFDFQTMRPGFQAGDDNIVVLGNEVATVSIEGQWRLLALSPRQGGHSRARETAVD